MSIHPDVQFETLEASERYGLMTRLVRRMIVRGAFDLTYTENGGAHDGDSYLVLFSALERVGMPVYGERLEGTSLVCVERNPKVMDKTTVAVDIVYEPIDNGYDDLDNPPFNVLFGQVRSTIQQVQTNKDADGNLIVLSHTWPDGTAAYKDAEGNTLARDPDYPGQTQKQTGTITYYQPQRSYNLSGIKHTWEPWLIEEAIHGKVNDAPWREKPAREWLCTSVTWKLHSLYEKYYGANPLGPAFLFQLEFQHNPDTWDPTATFVDGRTGQPPVGLIANTGYKTIEKLQEASFDDVIGSLVYGDYLGTPSA